MEKPLILKQIPIDHIRPSRFQARASFDDEAQGKLEQSMADVGLREPIEARPIPRPEDAPADDKEPWYEMVSGERRWRAALALKWRLIWAVIQEMTDEDAAIGGMVQNEVRKSLNPIERATGYRRLIDEFRYDQGVLAKKVGLTKGTISNILRVLDEPLQIQELLKRRSITEEHCRYLDRIEDQKKRVAVAHDVVQQHLSADATEKHVAKLLARRVKSGKKEKVDTGSEYSGFKFEWKSGKVSFQGRDFDPSKDRLDQFGRDLTGAIAAFMKNSN